MNPVTQKHEEAAMAHQSKKLKSWIGIDPVCGMEVSEESHYRFYFDNMEYR